MRIVTSGDLLCNAAEVRHAVPPLPLALFVEWEPGFPCVVIKNDRDEVVVNVSGENTPVSDETFPFPWRVVSVFDFSTIQ